MVIAWADTVTVASNPALVRIESGFVLGVVDTQEQTRSFKVLPTLCLSLFYLILMSFNALASLLFASHPEPFFVLPNVVLVHFFIS